MKIGLLVFAYIAGFCGSGVFATAVAHWDFNNASLVDSVSGLEMSLNPEIGVVSVRDGVVHFNNMGKSGSEGDLLVVDDSPVLTGHMNGGTGYKSLVVEVDVMLSQVGSQMQLVRKDDKGIGYQLYIRDDGRVAFKVCNAEASKTVTSKNPIRVDGQWHHIEAA